MKRKKGEIDWSHFVNADIVEAEWMQDPEFRREYDALEAEFQLIHALIDKRLEKKMTQKQLAEKIGTSQSAIARLESAEGNPSFKFLKRVAEGLDSKLVISFV